MLSWLHILKQRARVRFRCFPGEFHNLQPRLYHPPPMQSRTASAQTQLRSFLNHLSPLVRSTQTPVFLQHQTGTFTLPCTSLDCQDVEHVYPQGVSADCAWYLQYSGGGLEGGEVAQRPNWHGGWQSGGTFCREPNRQRQLGRTCTGLSHTEPSHLTYAIYAPPPPPTRTQTHKHIQKASWGGWFVFSCQQLRTSSEYTVYPFS